MKTKVDKENRILVVILSIVVVMCALLCFLIVFFQNYHSGEPYVEVIESDRNIIGGSIQYKVHGDLSPAATNKAIIMMNYDKDYAGSNNSIDIDYEDYYKKNFRKISEAEAEELVNQIAKECSDNYTITYEYAGGPPEVRDAVNWKNFGSDSGEGKSHKYLGDVTTYVVDGEFFVDTSGCKR